MKRDQNSVDFNKKALLAPAMAVLFFSSFVFADIGDSLVLCKHNKSVRTLRIDKMSDQRCKAVYTKQGVDQTIGASQSHSACEEYISGVRKTLEDAKWNCRDIKEARTSTVAPLEE